MNEYLIYIIILLIALVVLGAVGFGIRPVSVSNEEDSIRIEGKVSSIKEGGENDIIFKLDKHDEIFYINRGLEKGFTLEGLRDSLLGNTVIIKYPKHWSIISSNLKHLSEIEWRGTILYSEF